MSSGRSFAVKLLTVCVVLAGGLPAAPALAAQAGVPASFGSLGEGAGQFHEPAGIAIDQETGVDGANGDVYVVDRLNGRVDEFSGDGRFVRAWGWGVVDGAAAMEVCTQASGCRAGVPGAGEGQLSYDAEGIAVDNTSGLLRDLSHGDVYVTDPGNDRVEKFNAEGDYLGTFGNLGNGNGQFENPREIAVDPEGHVYVGDNTRLQRFSEAGVYEATVVSGVGSIGPLAAAPNGDVYVITGGQQGVHEYEPNGTEVAPVRGEQSFTRNLAVDGAGDLFVDSSGCVGEECVHRLLEYNSAGAQIESFDRAPYAEGAEKGMAWGESAEALYLININGTGTFAQVRVVSPLPPGPAVARETVAAQPGTHGSARVEAVVDPESAETRYFVEYGTTSALGKSSAVQVLPAGFAESSVTVELTGLEFSTEYHYCFRAENAHGRTPCMQGTFRSLPATSIDAEWATNVGAESATLHAEVNPEEAATMCRFEYGTMASHEATGGFEHAVSTPVVPGAEAVDVAVSAAVQDGITPGAEFAYRVVCEKESVRDAGAVLGFRTQLARRESGLPDDRTLELVAKQGYGATVEPPFNDLPQAAEGGDAVAYARSAAVTDGAEGNRSPEDAVDIAHHAANGWGSIDIVTPQNEPSPARTGVGDEYRLFSGDLSAAIIEPRDTDLLSPQASEQTPYRRVETAGTPLFEPLLTTADVAAGVKFGNAGELEGANRDLTHVVFSWAAPLVKGTAGGLYAPLVKGTAGGLYEWSAGGLAPVSVLPASEGGGSVGAALGAGGIGRYAGNRRDAVSADGSLVYWSYGHVYVRDTRTGESLRLDAPQGGSGSGPEGALYQLASADGSRVFFTSEQRLTADATASGADLYECAVSAPAAGPLACALSDVSAGVLKGEAAGVQGLVPAVDEAGTRVYFVATGVLASGATAGGENLYTAVEASGFWHVAWIATLSSADAADWDGGGKDSLDELSERASPDGRYFAFTSLASLTGYDNRDAVTGVPDAEAYVYDAQLGRLSCVSCDPTGARPLGPGILASWRGLGVGGSFVPSQPRLISDSGRLFFEGPSGLVPQASNGLTGVYEYEPAGVGSCSPAVPGYSDATGGCVQLLSPGTASRSSVFLDASAGGDDVFILAAVGGGLTEDAYSIYDAHSCEPGSGWVCTQPEAPTPPCSTTESCRSPAPPQPAIYGAPSSATFVGAGNIAPAVTVKQAASKRTVRCGKGAVRRGGRCVSRRRRRKKIGRAGVRSVRPSATRRGR